MITRIKWKNHSVLGNLSLDFQKPDGTPYKTIVFAGENGCGKTTILKTLSTFLNVGSFLPFDYIEYVQNGKVFQATSDDIKGKQGWDNDMFTGGHHYLFELSTNISRAIIANKNKLDPDDILFNGCVFSKARSGFKTKNIESVKTNRLDTNKFDDDSSDDFTLTKQLLVDIEAQDSSEWMDYSRSNPGADIRSYESKLRMFRFENAFNNFFKNIKFSKIATSQQGKNIAFTKYGKEINIDDLSTGEQQIVFRGTQLLKNSKSIYGGVVLIDEPELSMHPKWQHKILDYYRNLFMDNGRQMVQLFVATHSEEVIRSSLKDEDTLVIVLKNNNGIISPQRVDAPIILPSMTSAEINFLAFDIVSTDFHVLLYSTLQNVNNLNTIMDVDNYIVNSGHYDTSKHNKPYICNLPNGSIRTYRSLPTYIRNSIDHPDNSHSFADEELRESVNLLIKLVSPSFIPM